MLLCSERFGDGGSGDGVALDCFGPSAAGGEADRPVLAAVRRCPPSPRADGRANCRSEPPPRPESIPAPGTRKPLKPRILAVARAALLAALTVALTFWLARAPASLPALQAGASEAPPDLATLALDAVPVVADW